MASTLWILMRFEVLTTASMKMAVFWVVVSCSLVEVYQRFRCACRREEFCAYLFADGVI
jgi:hypothetical protein